MEFVQCCRRRSPLLHVHRVSFQRSGTTPSGTYISNSRLTEGPPEKICLKEIESENFSSCPQGFDKNGEGLCIRESGREPAIPFCEIDGEEGFHFYLVLNLFSGETDESVEPPACLVKRKKILKCPEGSIKVNCLSPVSNLATGKRRELLPKYSA